MGIGRVGPRLTLAEQMSRSPRFRGRQLAVETMLQAAGNRLVRAADMAVLAAGGIKKITAAVLSRASEIEIPKMMDIPGMSGKAIMRGEVPVGLFRRIMEGYEITGHNAEYLRAILADPARKSNALTYVSLLDGRVFATRLSEQTGRKFRVQTEEEWLAAGNQLSRDNWTLTETPHSSSTFVLRRLFNDGRYGSDPEFRSGGTALRLVEDISV